MPCIYKTIGYDSVVLLSKPLDAPSEIINYNAMLSFGMMSGVNKRNKAGFCRGLRASR